MVMTIAPPVPTILVLGLVKWRGPWLFDALEHGSQRSAFRSGWTVGLRGLTFAVELRQVVVVD